MRRSGRRNGTHTWPPISCWPCMTEPIRGPAGVAAAVGAARLGADICTCPPAVIDALFNHPLTDIGLKKFLADWDKAYGAAKV